MKKLSLMLAVVTIISLVFSSCANNGKDPVITTVAEITTSASTAGEPEATTDKADSDIIPEPQNPEPIYVGMTKDEFIKACEEWNDKLPNSVLKYHNYAFWLDENGYNAVAELEMVDNKAVVGNITRYKPLVPTKARFDEINGKVMKVQELVELLGRPVGGKNGNFFELTFLDETGLTYYDVTVNFFGSTLGPAEVRTRDSGLQNHRETIEKSMAKRYFLQNVEFHRVLLDKDEEGNCKMLVQGAHGENRAKWCVSLYAPESYYAQYFNYRQSEILYNAEITEEYSELFYAIPASVIYQIAYFVENDQYVIDVEIN